MIIPIDDPDDFLSIEAEAQRQAATCIQPWQRNLKPGDLFYRLHECGIIIFGEVLPMTGYDEPDDELMPDYRLTRCYSEVLPEGELGEIHISVVDGILTPEQFAEAKAKGWKLS